MHLKMAEALKEEALRLVQQLTELQLLEVCAGLALKHNEGKTDRKKALKSCLNRYLVSEELEDSADEGVAVFEKLIAEMKALVEESLEDDEKQKLGKLVDSLKPDLGTLVDQGASKANTNTVVTNGDKAGTSAAATGVENSSSVVGSNLHRIKLGQFKIHSGAVGGGGEGMLDFGDLVFQMQEGRRLGHSKEEVRAGVIRAMKSGSSLRKYCQGQPNMPEEDFMAFIRDDYGVKDSQKLMDEMVASAQEPKQTETGYLMKMMGLRDHILEVTKKEETPQSEELVYKRFFHALSVGFSNAAIRIELRPLLKVKPGSTWITDRALSAEVREAMTREEENKKRMKGRGTAGTYALDAGAEVFKLSPQCKDVNLTVTNN